MKSKSIMKFMALVFTLLGLLLTSSLDATADSTRLSPISYVTQSGSDGGQPVQNLTTQDQSGTADDPRRYVSFNTPEQIYRGFRRYILPNRIAINTISSLLFKVNFKGLAAASQTWTWSLYDWTIKKWVTIGNNKQAIQNRWTLLGFKVFSPVRFIDKNTREIRLTLQSNNAGGNAKIDYEAIFLEDTPTEVPTTAHFAVIGDYGINTANEAAVATLVKSWNPDFIITTGDNNYPKGESATIDQNIGQYYHDYIYPYTGFYGTGSPSNANRFFPSLGNHDWDSSRGADPYLTYFTLPGNERYYDFAWGPVRFFALDSDPREPDGTSNSSIQAAWLQAKLEQSAEPWNIVYMHHPPYSSSSAHGSSTYMQWDFKGMGADLVLAGHDHTYERLEIAGFPYIVNGLGGQTRYGFGVPIPGSLVRYNAQHGAMSVQVTQTQMTIRFIALDGSVIDTLTLP